MFSNKFSDVKPERYYVYCHISDATGDVFYIGKGMRARGWARGYRNPNWHKMSRGGVTVLVVKDNLDEEDAYSLEVEIISKIGLDNLSNVSKGGASPPSMSGKENPSRWRKVTCSNGMQFRSIKDAISWLSSVVNRPEHSSIVRACRNDGAIAYGYCWAYYPKLPLDPSGKRERFVDKRGKKVKCSNGMEFDSVSSAAKFFKSHNGSIITAIQRRGTSSGHTFAYAPDDPPDHPTTPPMPKGIRRNRSGVERSDGKIFKTITDAISDLKASGHNAASSAAISRCCKGKATRAYGFGWRYNSP